MRMRTLLALLVGLALLLPLPAGAQGPRPVAIADFSDESMDGRVIRAARLSVELQHLLDAQAGGRLRVLAGEEIRAALRARGYTPDDLVSPSRAADVGAAVGAEWITTGRWTQLTFTPIPDFPQDPTEPRVWGDSVAYAALQIRVLHVPSRRILLEQGFYGSAFGRPRFAVLLAAAREVLRDAAAGITRL